MSLPAWLRPWWRFFKRLHRLLTLLSGFAFRAVSRLLGERGVPIGATKRSVDTAANEPEAARVYPGQPLRTIERTPTQGLPEAHPVFAEARSVIVPATFTLEVLGGRLSGDYGATTTPGKLLDHETSTYFGVTNWREHPLFLHPTLGEIEHVTGTALSLTTRGTAQNYYHFLYDSIGRLGVLEESLPGQHIDAVIVPHSTGYQRQLLELAGVTGRLIQPVRGRTVSADRLLVPSNPNWALQAPPATVDYLRSLLRPSGSNETPTRLYLTRGTLPNTRRYVEEAELWPDLERQGFEKVDPGKLSVQEQIDLFHRAEVIIAPHGAALTNVTFSQPGVRVLEMFATNYVHLGLWAICQAMGASYRYLVSPAQGRVNGANSGVLDDVSIPPKTVLRELESLLA